MYIRLYSKLLVNKISKPSFNLPFGFYNSSCFKRPITTQTILQSNAIISSEELLNLIQGSKGPREYYLFDVREIEERRNGIIPTSIWVPLAKLESMLKMPEEKFKNSYKFNKFKLDDRLIFHCHSGKRSIIAQQMALQQGYTNSQNYLGSWLEFSKIYPNLVQSDNLLL